MRLVELHLHNYRRFRDASLEFPDGLIGLVGRNGAGKSSLLESILWCLFGHDALRTPKDLLKHQSAAPGDDLEARLVFELDGQTFEVARRLKGRAQQPEASVVSAGQALVAAGPNSWDQANRFLERLLGFDRLAFESTVIAKQGELAALSDLRPAHRKKLLLGMLGVERIEEAIALCRSQARLLEARVQEGRRALEGLPRLEAEQAESRTELQRAESSLARLETDLAALASRHAQAQEREQARAQERLRDQELRLRLQALQARLEQGWQQRSRLAAERQLLLDRQAQAERTRERLEALGDLDGRRQRLEEARARWSRAQDLRRRLEAVDRRRAELAPHAAPLDLNGDSPNHLRDELRRLQASLEDAIHRAAHHSAEAKLAESELLASPMGPAAAREEDPCPVCQRPFGDSLQRLRGEMDARARRLRKRQEEARRQWREAEAGRAATQTLLQETERRLRDGELRVERSRASRQELSRIDEERTALASELAGLPGEASAGDEEERLKRDLAERDALRLDLARAEEAAARIPRLVDEDRILRSQESEIQVAREAASRELQSLAYVPGSWEQARGEAEQAARALESAQREAVQWRERADARRREFQRLEEQAAQLQARRSELEASASELALLDALAGPRGDVGLLCEFKTHLIGRIRPSLSRATSDLLRVMTRGRYSELSLDDEYGAHLYDGAQAHPLFRFSGGEVDVSNLALRLAVSELVANARGRSRLQFVALDEVFGSQDEERRQSVVDALHSLSPVFRQILVVTHLEDVRERLEHVLRVEDGGDGASRLVASWQDKA